MWERVEGQERAVELLQRAAASPSHAYLFVGPPGSGVSEAVRCFAAALVCPSGGCGACRSCERALVGRHPDVTEVDVPEAQVRLEHVHEAVVEPVLLTPVEGPRKVMVVFEAERMNLAAQNHLLKTLEEPPAHAVIVLVTSAPDELAATVRSRCQVVVFSSATAAEFRAQRLAGPLAPLVEVFSMVPQRLDGTGASAAVLAGEISDALDRSVEGLKDSHRGEREGLEAELEVSGYADRDARRILKPVIERHDRVERRARTDALAEGLAIVEAAYRDALMASTSAPEPVLDALDALARARRAITEGVVLNWGLLVEDLLLSLPGQSGPPDTLARR
ncbi:MAG: hypothetical protein HYU28_06920 [Actinobacteria bacterium]|nr:hypothetical protein [Actinomycetota bacterium]